MRRSAAVRGKHVAIDLGAESGRIIVGDVTGIDVVHRFPNLPVKIGESIFWDVLSIFSEIKEGLRKAFRNYPGQIASMALDTWGVDYGLVDSAGMLIGNPYHYRDNRTDGVPEEIFEKVGREEIYRATGIQFMQINTIYQLYSFARQSPELYRAATRLLHTPDLFNYWLTGRMTNEYSIATTSQLFDPTTKRWSNELIAKLGLNPKLFDEVVMPGTVIGELLPSIAAEVGAEKGVAVVAPACHDTGSAVAAVPVTGGRDYAYLSSGTWSLLGIESPEPIINAKSYQYNFTNEGAADGGIRFLKNIMGLWIVQECKRYWDGKGMELDYAELTKLAEEHGPADFRIDPDDARFLKPSIVSDSMPDRICSWCRENGEKVPDVENPSQIARGVLDSLSDAYKKTITMVEDISGRKIEELYIIGGGSQNRLLCQLAADSTGIPVFAGPVEATAIGNIMIQQLALGGLQSYEAGRELVRKTYKVERYDPAR